MNPGSICKVLDGPKSNPPLKKFGNHTSNLNPNLWRILAELGFVRQLLKSLEHESLNKLQQTCINITLFMIFFMILSMDSLLVWHLFQLAELVAFHDSFVESVQNLTFRDSTKFYSNLHDTKISRRKTESMSW